MKKYFIMFFLLSCTASKKTIEVRGSDNVFVRPGPVTIESVLQTADSLHQLEIMEVVNEVLIRDQKIDSLNGAIEILEGRISSLEKKDL